MNKTIQIQHYHSPCGDLILGSYGNELCLCNWVIEKHQGRVDKRLQTRSRPATGRIFWTETDDVRYTVIVCWYRFSKKCMACVVGNTLWTDAFLWRDGSTARIAECCPCGGECEWSKCNIHLCSLSSGYRE